MRLSRVQGATAIGDQLVSSASNLAFLLLAAHVATPVEFGVLSTLLIAHGLLLGCSRAAIGEASVLLAASQADRDGPEIWGRSLRQAAGASTAVVVITTIYGLAMADPVGTLVATMGVATAIVLGQDLVRYLSLSRHQAGRTLGLDLSWLLVQLAISVALLVLTTEPSVSMFVLAWAAGALVSLLLGFCTYRHGLAWRPSSGGSSGTGDERRTLARTLLADFLLLTGTVHLGFLTLSAVIGAAAFGELRLALVAVGVIANVVAPLRVSLLADFRSTSASTVALARTARVVGLGLGALVLVLGIGLTSIPDGIGTTIFSDVWVGAGNFLVGATLAEALRVAAFPLVDLVKARLPARTLLWSRATTALAVGLGIVVGGVVSGGAGALISLLVTQVFAYSVWTWHIGRASTTEDPRPSLG